MGSGCSFWMGWKMWISNGIFLMIGWEQPDARWWKCQVILKRNQFCTPKIDSQFSKSICHVVRERERGWTGKPNKKSEKKERERELQSSRTYVPLKIKRPGRLTAGSHTHGGGCFRWFSFLFMGVEHGSIGEQAVNLPGCTVPVSFKKHVPCHHPSQKTQRDPIPKTR